MTARFVVADVFDGIASLENGSVDLVLTSPPFLALRSYLPANHPDKAKEIGSEPTPEQFIDTLLDVVEALTPKLTEYGSIAFELGDTYSGSGGAGGDYNVDGWREEQPAFVGSGLRNRGRKRAELGIEPPDRNASGPGWPLAKSLCLIPESFRWALVYGRNPFNGRTTERWRARNVIRWCRPNPPVGALGDKFRPATSEMVVACKSAKRWFDLDAVREPNARSDETGGGQKREVARQAVGLSSGSNIGGGIVQNPAGAPPLDWWEISTESYKGSHYATWPRKLLDRPILAMCPRKVCRTCGEPSRRIVGEAEYEPSASYRGGVLVADADRVADGANQWTGSNGEGRASVVRVAPTLGWTDCGHDHWRRGVVLDCFAGSGTTLQVSEAHGRDSIGIDLDARNAELAVDRCGMFLTVEHLPATCPSEAV